LHMISFFSRVALQQVSLFEETRRENRATARVAPPAMCQCFS